MNIYYNVEIQTSGTNELTDIILDQIMHIFKVDEMDIDERESYRAVLFFKSECNPSEMRNRVKQYFQHGKPIHYIDVVYRWEHEMNADRFVYWGDGREQNYVGKIIFEEEKIK